MDTARSGFLTALEAFWNGWGNMRHQLLLVVCGSATSWMLDNLINNKGGLYARLTGEIKLYKAPYVVTKGYAQVLNSRLQTLEEKNPAKTFLLTYVGNSELVSNEYSDIFKASVTLDDLFV